MEDLNELLEHALIKIDSLTETLEDAKAHQSAHEASFEDILYELSEIRSSVEDQIES